VPEHAWHLRIVARSARSSVVYTRQHRFEVGPSLSFDPQAPLPTALEHVLGAVGADVVSALHAAARRRRLVVDGIEAAVDGRLENPLMALGVVGEAGTPRLAAVELRVYVSSVEPEPSLRAAWDEALSHSPMAATFLCAGILRPALVVAP